MPSAQAGALSKRGERWTVRYRDDDGVRRRRTFGPGREGKAEASAWLARELEKVEALRRGDVAALRRASIPTLQELVDEFLGQHNAEANTIRTLRARLRYATEGPALNGEGGFGPLPINRRSPTWRTKPASCRFTSWARGVSDSPSVPPMRS